MAGTYFSDLHYFSNTFVFIFTKLHNGDPFVNSCYVYQHILHYVNELTY